METQLAIQNLDLLRQLIAETRQNDAFMDALRLRMIQGTGMGTDGVEDSR